MEFLTQRNKKFYVEDAAQTLSYHMFYQLVEKKIIIYRPTNDSKTKNADGR